MRCPSAYCATSSGIAIVSMRVSTQPAFLSAVRTRLQSSIGTDTAGFDACGLAGGGTSDLGTDSATQLDGGFGAGGAGGGPILTWACRSFDFRRGATCFGGAGGATAAAGWMRGVSL